MLKYRYLPTDPIWPRLAKKNLNIYICIPTYIHTYIQRVGISIFQLKFPAFGNFLLLQLRAVINLSSPPPLATYTNLIAVRYLFTCKYSYTLLLLLCIYMYVCVWVCDLMPWKSCQNDQPTMTGMCLLISEIFSTIICLGGECSCTSLSLIIISFMYTYMYLYRYVCVVF